MMLQTDTDLQVQYKSWKSVHSVAVPFLASVLFSITSARMFKALAVLATGRDGVH